MGQWAVCAQACTTRLHPPSEFYMHFGGVVTYILCGFYEPLLKPCFCSYEVSDEKMRNRGSQLTGYVVSTV